MPFPPQHHISRGCGSAHPQPHVSAKAANFVPTSGSGRNTFTKQSGLKAQPFSHQNLPPCPPCHTQLALVTSCCFFNQCIVCEEKNPLSLSSPAACQLGDPPHYQQLHRDFDCPVLHLAPSATGELVLPSWASGLHICVDIGACKRHCRTRSHLGKRMYLAARRTLARFSLKFLTHDSTSRTGVQGFFPPAADSGMSWESNTASRTELQGFLTPEADSDMSWELDSTSRTELQGFLTPEADSDMSWGLPTREIDHAPRELPAELWSEEYVPHEPIQIQDFPSRSPALCQPISQASMSTLDTSVSDVYCPRLASESQNQSDETIDEDFGQFGIEENDADYIQFLCNNVKPRPASEAVTGDRNFPAREMNTFAGRAEFCQSPTSISSETELKKVELHIKPCAATIGAFAEPSVFASGQASCTSNDHTLESTGNLCLRRQACHGTLTLQSPDFQLSSPSNQHSLSSENSSCNESASICDCLYPQRLTLLRGQSSSELLETLNSRSGKLQGLKPSNLLDLMGGVFESTTERSLRRLNGLEKPEHRAVAEPVYRIKPTLDIGLSALKSLVIGQVPNRLNEVMSLVFIAYAVVTMLGDEQSEAQFTHALFLDDLQWINAIGCCEEQDAFEMLVQCVWMPAAVSSVCPHGHRWPSHMWSSFRSTRIPFERTYTPFEEGWLALETEIVFRLRTGSISQICQWYVDYVHTSASLYGCREPFSPSSYWVGTPPSFKESVRNDFLRPCTERPLSDICNRALSTLTDELDSGQFSTYDQVASFLSSQISRLEPELAHSVPIISARCRGAQAIYNSDKVCWLRDWVRQAANGIVSPSGGGDQEALRQPLANADRHRLHELDGLSDAPSLPVGSNTASSTPPPATSPNRKRKSKLLSKEPGRSAPDGEVLQVTKCPHCKQTFSGIASDQRSNLARHMEHKHPLLCQASTHVCAECGRGFPRSDYLLNHRRAVHNLC